MALSIEKFDESDTAGGPAERRAGMDLDLRSRKGGELGSIQNERVCKILELPMGAMAAVTQQYSV